MKSRKPSKRPILLLEVLIAFALVALCVFPLIAPHVFMLKAQYQFNSKIALDQSAGKVYAHILERAYRNEIPWQAIEERQIFPLDEELMKGAGLAPDFTHRGTYRLSILRHKGGKEHPMSANVVNATITFEPKTLPVEAPPEEKLGQQSVYEYKFFAARIKEQQPTENNEDKTPSSHTP